MCNYTDKFVIISEIGGKALKYYLLISGLNKNLKFLFSIFS